MNRRSFLTSAGATAACLATAGGSTSRKLFAQDVDPGLLNACVDNNAIAAANMYYNSAGAGDFYGLAWANSTLAQHCRDTGVDAAFNQTALWLSPGQLNPSQVDVAGVTANIQRFCPDLQVSDMQDIFNRLPTDPDSIASGLATVQQYGLSSMLDSSAAGYYAKAGYLSGNGEPTPIAYKGTRTPSYPRVINKVHRPQMKPHLQKAMYAFRPFMTITPEGGAPPHKPYTCESDNRMQAAFGTFTFMVTIVCMAGWVTGLVCGPVFGIISGVWLIGHIAVCGGV
jgi:hypothetical protein